MKKAVASLKSGKGLDVNGVTAEHIYYGSPVVMICVQALINNILFNKDMKLHKVSAQSDKSFTPEELASSF